MADEEDDGKADKKKKNMKIIGAVVAAGVVYQFVLAPKPAPEEEAALEEGVERVIEEGDVVSVPELILNLADEDELRYLRVGIAVVLELGTVEADIEPKIPLISDVVVDVLSAKTMAELREPGAKETAKEELSEQVRAVFDDAQIARVIFTSFVMQ